MPNQGIMTEINFYRNLQPLTNPVTGIFEQQYFSEVPGSWHVIIADVKNSTAAVGAGNHYDVNLVAACSLIAGINIAKKYKIEIPYFFGGDGGILLVPDEILTNVQAALATHHVNSIKNFGLEMYIGSMSIKDILNAGHSIKIAKQQVDNYFNKAVIIGDGLQYAEQQIKHTLNEPNKMYPSPGELILDGLQCKWDKIKPPGEHNEVVCYLIEALHPEKQLKLYTDILLKIEDIFGDQVKRHPIAPERLKLLVTYDKIKKEMLARFGKWKFGYFIYTYIYTYLGQFYFRYNWKINKLKAQDYLTQLVAHTDTLSIDGRINTIISGSSDKHIHFMYYLSQLEKDGQLVFGHHASKESVITCYIEDLNVRHIHFIDGSDGGYTEAAKGFKMKLQLMQSPTYPHSK